MFLRYRHLIVGLGLGFFALLGYLVEAGYGSQFPLSASHFFIIMAALAAGPEAALIAFAVGSFPSILFDEGNFRYTVQSALIVSAILVQRRWLNELPAYFVVLLAWLLVVIPLHAIFPEAHWHSAVPGYIMGLQALSDVFLTAFASSILFIPWVCENILEKPYQPNREKLFAAVCGTFLSLVGLCGLFMTPTIFMDGVYQATSVYDLGLVLTLSVLIVGISTFGSRWLDLTVSEISPHSTKARLSGSFSPDELLPAEELNFPKHNMVADSLMDLPTAAVIPPGVCALKSDGTVLFANQRFLELIQTSEKDLSGKRLFDLPMDNQMRSALQDLTDRAKDRKQLSGEFKLNELPERLRYFSLSIEPHHNGDEECGVLLTLQEITDRRAIEYHLLEAQKMKNIGSVMGSIAHAFNNSLTAIIGSASFALRTHDSESQQLALREIKEQAQKAGELVWKLLDFSEGKPTPFQSLPISRLLPERLELLQKLVGESCQISISEQEDEDLWIMGDPNLLMQVLTELITNAKDSYRDGVGEIQITLCSEEMDEDIAKLHPGAKPGEYARLTVKDTGCGMSPEMVSQAFAPLVSTKTRYGNSGLGLSIVYAILRAHDGFLTVESFPEKGTTISVYIPTTESVEEAKEASCEHPVPAASDKTVAPEPHAHILVVEDAPEVRDLVGKMLEMLGYKVTTCSNAEEATQVNSKESFDLMLVDYMMPYMSGLDLIRAMQEQGLKDTQYILMSGCGNLSLNKFDSISILPKPFDIDTLGETITDVLSKPSSESLPTDSNQRTDEAPARPSPR